MMIASSSRIGPCDYTPIFTRVVLLTFYDLSKVNITPMGYMWKINFTKPQQLQQAQIMCILHGIGCTSNTTEVDECISVHRRDQERPGDQAFNINKSWNSSVLHDSSVYYIHEKCNISLICYIHRLTCQHPWRLRWTVKILIDMANYS